jgi:hypothetical protein
MGITVGMIEKHHSKLTPTMAAEKLALYKYLPHNQKAIKFSMMKVRF